MSKLPPDAHPAAQYTPPQMQRQLVQPGADGGCEFPAAAFSPRTQYVYCGTRYEPSVYHSFPGDLAPNDEGEFLGSIFAQDIPGVTPFETNVWAYLCTGKYRHSWLCH